ncbi:MAG: hypothetical protein R3B72_42455 [Polyangiaceae bacterium]
MSRLAVLGLVVLAFGCGISSSESPWPVEPIDVEPGPAGEDLPRGNVIATEDLPNNYEKGQGGGASEEEEEEREPEPDE